MRLQQRPSELVAAFDGLKDFADCSLASAMSGYPLGHRITNRIEELRFRGKKDEVGLDCLRKLVDDVSRCPPKELATKLSLEDVNGIVQNMSANLLALIQTVETFRRPHSKPSWMTSTTACRSWYR